MRYICSVCGYVYDEAKEKKVFSELPESWTCPLCGAPKALFAPEKGEKIPESKPAAAVWAEADEDMRKLSAGELSALCSNLARGCEKQYKEEEAALFREIAGYFAAVTPEEPDADLAVLGQLLQRDLEEGYPAVSSTAQTEGDRGTQRVYVWGEKVTNILNSLIRRYQREGGAFLKHTQIWVCSVCGFVFVGDRPPEICPVCKVPAWKFEKIEGREL